MFEGGIASFLFISSFSKSDITFIISLANEVVDTFTAISISGIVEIIFNKVRRTVAICIEVFFSSRFTNRARSAGSTQRVRQNVSRNIFRHVIANGIRPFIISPWSWIIYFQNLRYTIQELPMAIVAPFFSIGLRPIMFIIVYNFANILTIFGEIAHIIIVTSLIKLNLVFGSIFPRTIFIYCFTFVIRTYQIFFAVALVVLVACECRFFLSEHIDSIDFIFVHQFFGAETIFYYRSG